MDKIESNLNRCLQHRLLKAKLSWADVSRSASEIIAFGSRAAGVNRKASDLDVLFVGDGVRRMKGFGLDVVCISSVELASPNWLDSELAGHISKYGIWLKGSGQWRNQVFIGSEAESKKERRLVSLVRSVKRSWPRLHPAFQFKYRLTIRRELQRLTLLRAAVPIPPTPVLDADWQAGKSERDVLLQVPHSILNEAEEFIARTVLT